MSKSRFGRTFATLFLICWVVLFAGVAGVRWGVMPVTVGLLMVSVSALVLLLYGLLTLPVVIFKGLMRKPLSSATVTRCVLGLLPVSLLLLSVGVDGLRAPAIHDITTDTENPPEFVLAREQREAGDNSIEYEGEVIARLQEEAYPDVTPLMLDQPPQQVLTAVVDVVESMGWTLLGTKQEELTVEAVAHSALFGFEDDVIIRVTPVAQGSRVDIRSASRVGLGDLGANAKRIRAFKAELAEKFLK